MPWIETISDEDATGALAKEYEKATARAGRVYGIVRTMSLSPPVMAASMGLYGRIMHGGKGLSRRQREMIAVVVSRTNSCHY